MSSGSPTADGKTVSKRDVMPLCEPRDRIVGSTPRSESETDLFSVPVIVSPSMYTVLTVPACT